MDLLALGMAAGALALLIVGLSMIFNGRVGAGVVVALVVGGAGGSLAAFA